MRTTFIFCWLILSGLSSLSAAEVNLYSARKEQLIRPLLNQFTQQTGIKVNLVTGKADILLQRLQIEGEYSPADLLITTDAGRLYRAKMAGVLRPLQDEMMQSSIPVHLRDAEVYWFGLSQRARVIFYARDRLQADAVNSYEDLAKKKWQGRICIRSSNNIYNQSLVAAIIAQRGKLVAQQWLQNLVGNFARKPNGGDRDQIKAVATGLCDLAVANTYYYGKMLFGKDVVQREIASKVGIIWPDQAGNGAHINISGIALTKAARNYSEALALMHFLLSDEAQAWYAQVNYEYPVKPGVVWSPQLLQWGTFKADQLSLSVLGELNADAVRMMDKVGWR